MLNRLTGCIFLSGVLLLLSSCVRYNDIHGNSTALNAKTLSHSNRYSAKTLPKPSQSGYWIAFKDQKLDQLISTALNDSPSMQIANNRAQTAKHLAEVEEAALWPSLDFNGNYQRSQFAETGLVPPPYNGKAFNIGNVGLNFNYEFDFWGKNKAAFQAKIGEALAVKADADAAALILSSEVANTYFELRNDITQAQIAQAQYVLQQQNLTIVTDRMHHGILSTIPMKTVVADVASAKQIADVFHEKAQLAEAQLAVYLGKNPLNTHIQTSQTEAPIIVTLPKALPAHLLANRPDILAAKWRVEAAAKQIHVAKARFFPDINLNVLLGYQSAILHLLFQSNNQTYTVTSAVDLPIFDAGERRATLKARYAEYDEAVNQYNAVILKALFEVASQLTIIHTVNAELISQQTSLNAMQTSYHLSLLRYHHGVIDYAQLLQIKNALLMQQAQKANLTMQQLKATASLLAALGGQND